MVDKDFDTLDSRESNNTFAQSKEVINQEGHITDTFDDMQSVETKLTKDSQSKEIDSTKKDIREELGSLQKDIVQKKEIYTRSSITPYRITKSQYDTLVGLSDSSASLKGRVAAAEAIGERVARSTNPLVKFFARMDS